MKKFNWGHGIFLFYVVFVLVLISALVASTRVDHSLVVDDYYAKDLAYQKMYEKKSNQLNDKQLDIQYDRMQKVIKLNFLNTSDVSGTVHFYRPSDKSKDFTKQLSKSSDHHISTYSIQPGVWRIKVDWIQEGKSYFEEKEIYI